MYKKLTYGMLFAASLSLAACSSKHANSSKQKQLTVTMVQQPSTADPNKMTDTYSTSMVSQTMEALYDVNNDGKLVPGVATKIVKPTNDGKTYTLHLRKNAKWQNNESVTAQDFVTSFDRQVDPKTKSQYANRFQNFTNFAAVQSNKKSPAALGVKALNKHTLRVTLSKADPEFNYRAATEYYPLNTAAVKKFGNTYGTSSAKTVSNGPFKLSNWDSTKDTWVYQKNNNFWDAKTVKLPSVKVQVVKDANTAQNLFASGKIQETQISGESVKDDAKKYGKEVVYTKKGMMRFLNFNAKNKLTSNRNFRLAVSYSLNRKQLTDKVFQDGSTPAKSLVPEGDGTSPTGKDYNTYLKQTLQFDKTRAKTYWEKAQKQLGKKNVSVELLTEDNDNQKQLGEYIQSAVQSNLPGVKVKLNSIPQQQQLTRMFSGNYQITALGWTTDFPDPSDYLNLMTKNNTVNFTHWTNKQYEAVMKKVNNSADYTKQQRWNLMVKAGNLMIQQQPLVPTYQDTEVHLVSSKVAGLKYTLLTESRYRYAYWK